jgi:hypothetical protein
MSKVRVNVGIKTIVYIFKACCSIQPSVILPKISFNQVSVIFPLFWNLDGYIYLDQAGILKTTYELLRIIIFSRVPYPKVDHSILRLTFCS